MDDFYVKFKELLDTKDENKFILGILNMRLLNINNIKKFLFYLEENKYYLSFKICVLLYVKEKLLDKIEKYPKINYRDFWAHVKKFKRLKEVNDERQKIRCINRLIILVDKIGIGVIKNFVPLLEYEKALKMNAICVIRYYNDVIKRIKKSLLTYCDICDVLYDIKNTIKYVYITKNPLIQLKEYDIIIEEKN